MSKKILIIEHDPVLRELARKKFQAEHFEVVMAPDAISGIVEIKLKKPDAVLMDIALPGADGFEILKEIKEDKFVSHTPVIMISNLAERQLVQKSRVLGAHACVEKSQLASGELVRQVKSILA